MTEQKTTVRQSEPWQRQRINMLINRLGLQDAKADIVGAESTTSLSYHAARTLIDKLSERAIAAGVWVKPQEAPKGKRTKFITPGTLSTLRYYAIACAIHYVAWGEYTTDNGEILEGDQVRDYLRRRFELGRLQDANIRVKNPIPKQLLLRMYSEWINPTSNRFLLEGGWRVSIDRMERCFYDQLTEKEGQYLVNRFREMYGVLEKQNGTVSYPILNPSAIGGAGCPINCCSSGKVAPSSLWLSPRWKTWSLFMSNETWPPINYGKRRSEVSAARNDAKFRYTREHIAKAIGNSGAQLASIGERIKLMVADACEDVGPVVQDFKRAVFILEKASEEMERISRGEKKENSNAA